MKSGNLNFLEPSGPLQACNRTTLPFFFFFFTTYTISANQPASSQCQGSLLSYFELSNSCQQLPRDFLPILPYHVTFFLLHPRVSKCLLLCSSPRHKTHHIYLKFIYCVNGLFCPVARPINADHKRQNNHQQPVPVTTCPAPISIYYLKACCFVAVVLKGVRFNGLLLKNRFLNQQRQNGPVTFFGICSGFNANSSNLSMVQTCQLRVFPHLAQGCYTDHFITVFPKNHKIVKFWTTTSQWEMS